MPYSYVDILTAPYIYYATLNTFECFKMHCNVSQWLVTHLQRVQWMMCRYASWEMIYFTAFSFGCTATFFQTWVRATCLTSFQSRPRGSRAFCYDELWKILCKLAGCTLNVQYGVRGVLQIKFTMSDSFLVFYDFDTLSMIKRKNPFRFYCVILILNLSRLISQMYFWFPKFDAFDF